jgi:aryl-alcohol dehydrogenase-like predicted oxidoreductase
VGAFSWGSRYIWGYGKGLDAADLKAAFDESVKSGISFYDTAEIYGSGRSERLLGQFIRESGARVVVASKFFPFPWRLSRHSLLHALRESLNRLGLDRLDLYQVHMPSPPLSIETWMQAMAEAVEAGLIRAVGVSNYDGPQMRRAFDALAKRGVKLASNQVDYSLLHRGPERNGVTTACKELCVTLMAYTPLASGMLTGKYTPQTPPPGYRALRYHRGYRQRMQPLMDLLRQLGERYGGRTPAQVAINWTIAKGALPIPGAKTSAQARENAGALGWLLSPTDVAALDEASERLQ